MIATKKIVLVNGFAIRNTLDDDFGIYQPRLRSLFDPAPKFYIPENEVWVDYRYKDEVEFLTEVDVFTYPTATESYEKRRHFATTKFCVLVHVINSIQRSIRKD